MKKILVLIPLYYNNKRPVPKKELRQFEEKLLGIAGGFSDDGRCFGAWIGSENQIMRDVNQKYTIAVRSRKQINEIRELVRETGKRLEQQAMYFEVSGTIKIQFLEIEW